MKLNARHLAAASPYTRKSKDTHKHKPSLPIVPIVWRNGVMYEVRKNHLVVTTTAPQERDTSGCAKRGQRWNRDDRIHTGK